ncbi:hypothetical protein DS745_18965 [Anaerobacillus alkaliphilus]|uniref:SPOR domain-containing protein n=1 Tax=Anaerobacillus alkaliphilus TaxID=1548597 RepID=A0A4Q0VQ65_9BACI|nr:hypothetical protein [Anaerobacillus alkaliphilus]RXI98408.1 hypothetical protein DS745_18965 [Anaerobacillus alkaliphilus]
MDNTKKNDRRISIVLNGKEKLYEELEKDKQAYEEVLNEEIAATQEEERSEEFEWILSDPSQKKPATKVVDIGERRRDKKRLVGPYWDDGKSVDSPKLPSTKRKKKQNFEFKSLPLGLIGIVLSAIVVGVSFGFMMLTIFTGEKGDPLVTPTTTPVQSQPQVEAPIVMTPGQIPILGVEVVQGGAYSLLEKGQEVSQELISQGFAAAVTQNTDPVFLFIGLGLDKEQAAVVAEKYRENGQEVYLKPYAVTATGIIETQEQASYLETGVDLYQQLTLLAVNGMATGGSLITDETLNELTETYKTLISIVDPFLTNDIHQQNAVIFQTALTGAYESIKGYASTNNQSNLWKAQQYLLDGLFAYENLIKNL